MKASAMTTEMVVASIIAIIKQCRYYNRAGYTIIVWRKSHVFILCDYVIMLPWKYNILETMLWTA